MKTKLKICSAILMLVIAVAFAGCSSTPASRIKANPQLSASIAPADQALIKQGQIALGFTPDMVKLALGKPDIIAQPNSSTEIWRYQKYKSAPYTYTYATTHPYGPNGPYVSPYLFPSLTPPPSSLNAGTGTPYSRTDWNTVIGDYLRVTFSNGRVTAISRSS